MNQRQRKLLDTMNLKDIDFEQFSRFLQKEGLILEQDIDNITRRYNATYVRNFQLLEVLKDKFGDSGFAKFEQAFLKMSRSKSSHSTSHSKTIFNTRTLSARRMFEKLWLKFGDSSQPKPLGLDNQQPSTTSTVVNTLATSNRSTSPTNSLEERVVCYHPYTSSHSCSPYASSSSDSDTSSDSLVLDPGLTDAIAKEVTHQMTVQPATIIHNNPDEDYKMTSDPRGLCLIVNNINFEQDIFPERKGSDEDAKRFDDIFQQLGFKVIMTRNQTADQMRQQFKDVAAACKQEHDALFVFILSHGSEHGIYGTDGMEVNLQTEVLSYFDNRNCKMMLGKPKVFVLQACRGRAADYGGDGDALDSIAWSDKLPRSAVNRVPKSLLPWCESRKQRQKHPIRTDMLLVFSCLQGFVSVRNELAGSWLGVALAYFIMMYAHEKDLQKIINLATGDVIQRESSSGHMQSIDVQLIGWSKNLFFNPGHPKTSAK